MILPTTMKKLQAADAVVHAVTWPAHEFMGVQIPQHVEYFATRQQALAQRMSRSVFGAPEGVISTRPARSLCYLTMQPLETA